MTYRQAKQLHIGDIVEKKHDQKPMTITDLEVNEKDVFIQGNDGRLYHHTAVKSSERK